MRRVVVDTGPLYALVDPDDRLHERARREAAYLGRGGWAILAPTPVLLEGHSLVLHRIGIAAAQRWTEGVLAGAGVINPTTDDYLAAARLLAGFHDQEISLTDALVAVLAQSLEYPVWTFDHHFDVLRVAVWRP